MSAPALGAQLKSLRDKYGEGFTGDVAQPLALAFQALAARLDRRSDAAREREAALDEREHHLAGDIAAAEQYAVVCDLLEDVRRGVRTIDEVLDAMGSGA